MRKFENILATIIIGVLMLTTSLRGAWEILYYDLDMYYEQAFSAVVIFGIVAIYWVIKTIVLRIISIAKK